MSAVIGEQEDKEYTAIIYSAQFKVNFKHPLNGKEYIGQCVRVGSPLELLASRRREHELLSVRKQKEFGFHALLCEFGPTVFQWKILDTCKKNRTDASTWANAKEINAIAVRGGTLKSWVNIVEQTLNLQIGGTGDGVKCLAFYILRSHKAWNIFLDHLKNYKAQHGTYNTPRSYVCDDGYQLGNQLNTVRAGKAFVKGFPERAEVLLKLGVKMKYRDAWRDSKWNVFFGELMAFVMHHGHPNVPQKYINCATEYKLGMQVNDLRTKGQYLSEHPERVKDLEDLGFQWSVQKERRDNAWKSFIDHLNEYKAKHGHLNIPHEYRTSCGFKLGYAASNCKRRADYHRFKKDRVELLVSIGFPLCAKVLGNVHS